MNNVPLLSVVMPTYNASVPILKEAVDSIMNQSFRNFEYLIIDDGSSDETPDYLDSLTDPRIRIIRNKRNIGITKSLNIGFREARGKYIARMDSDDISMPDRFEKQVDFMEKHPDVVVCGSEASFYKGDTHSYKRTAHDMERYRIRMLFTNPGPIHSTAFFRREVMLQHHIIYDENLKYAQDYGMWMTISKYGRIYILPEKLLLYRQHRKQISKEHREEQIHFDKMTQKALLCRLVESVSKQELDLHYHYSTGYYQDVRMTDEVEEWYMRLIKANDTKGIYDRKKFRIYVYNIFFRTIFLTWQTGITGKEKIEMLFRYIPWYVVLNKFFFIAINKFRKMIF